MRKFVTICPSASVSCRMPSTYGRYGAGKVSCSAAALVPGLYLAELFASFILLAGGKERGGRILLLGLLIFLAMAVLALFGLLARWLANATGT